MKELAAGVRQLDGRPANMINVYVLEDVLIDAGVRLDAGRILRQLNGSSVVAHAPTDAHPDHLGASHEVCERLGVPFWVGERDRVLIAGDVIWNFQFAAGRPGMTQPLPTSSTDPALNRDSARRLAALEPDLVCFGHGPPLRDRDRFVDFAQGLPA